jgi:outer membrane protein OmpA-like peptidoglycan-associated protein
MKTLIIILAIIAVHSGLASQELISIKNATACETAIEISTLSKFGPTGPPKEVKIDAPSPFTKSLFQVWYRFKTEKEGLLLFDIIPVDPADNYDFLLYKAENPKFCGDIKSGKLIELRANLSRNEPELNGITGLSITGQPEPFSPGIEVKPDEEYILVLNSMYKCKGHTIVFKYLENLTIYGKINHAENNQTIQAQVFWTNLRTKETTSSVISNKQGDYQLPVLVNTEAHRFPSYLLWVYAEGFYISDTLIASRDIPKLDKTPFNFRLNKLKKGNNEFLPKFFFEPNDERLVSNSIRDLERVLRLMQQNPKIEIQLEGHSNGIYPSTEIDINLSTKRAQTVKKWLVENGISSERIETKGFGSEKMLFPMAQDENEEQMNRRVEINIVKM